MLMMVRVTQQLRDQLGACSVSATSGVDVDMATLIAKVRIAPGFTETERVTLIRALEWCVRREHAKKDAKKDTCPQGCR